MPESVSKTIKEIYKFVEDRFQVNDFTTVDRLLGYFDPALMSPEEALAVLTITAAARSQLINRRGFYKRTRNHFLTVMPLSEAEANLRGLE